MTYAQAAATYQRNAVLNASPEKIVKLLYEGAVRHLERSRTGLEDPRGRYSPEVGIALGKAMAILGELRASLDRAAGGEIAASLDGLYEFSIDRISQANLRRTPEPVNHALNVVRTLKEGWDAVIPN
jgi:flagellar protein FliS